MPDAEQNTRPADRIPIEGRRHPLVTEIDRRLRTDCRIAGDGPVVVGCSGGPDSVALLLGLSVVSRRRSADGWTGRPIAVHVHHHLRGTEADADLAFVQRLCNDHGITMVERHIHPDADGGNLASTARRLRYGSLTELARETNAAAVAVGHHLDDQVETVLMALGRGAGLDGLAGMSWRRDQTDAPPLIRPLLRVRKEVCEDFCRVAGVSWRVDTSNEATMRGRLRSDVVPVLESVFPEIGEHASHAAEIIGATSEVVDQAIAAVFGPPGTTHWDRSTLQSLPRPLIATGLRRAAREMLDGVGIDQIGAVHLDAVADAILEAEPRPRRFDWPAGLVVRLTAHTVDLHVEA